MTNNNYLGEIGIILLLIITAITIIPLLTGVIIAILLQTTGITYIITVLTTALIIYGILTLYIYI